MICLNKSKRMSGVHRNTALNPMNNPFTGDPFSPINAELTQISLSMYEIGGLPQELENLRRSFDELVQTHNELLIECQGCLNMDPQMLIVPQVWVSVDEIVDFNNEISCLTQNYHMLFLTHKRILIEHKYWMGQD